VSSNDGVAALIVSGVAVAGKFALGDVLGPYLKPEDANADGIDAAYDTDNSLLAYRHIVDFYTAAGNGVELYVMAVAQTVTMEDMCDKTKAYAAKLLEVANGKVRLVGITRVPDAGYTATLVDGLDDDATAAAVKAQALFVESFAKFRPVSFLIEGRDFQGTPGDLLDLRDEATGPNANRVAIVLSADTVVSAADAKYGAYANVGFALGRYAGIPVQRDPGRVRDGAMAVSNVGLSDGSLLSAYDETDLVAIDAKGYMFLWQHTGKAGYYFNMGHAACPIDDDYSYMQRGRVIDKAARLIREVYLDDLLDEIEVDATTGKLTVGVVKNFQERGKKMIETNMLANQEISGCGVYVDAGQNVLSTDKIEVQLTIVPMGLAKEIVVNLGFSNPQSA